MDEARKELFRELLYQGMVEIRLATGPQRFWQRRQQTQFAHEVAEWLHNLAQFSALNFERFDEQRFWDDYRIFRLKYPLEKRQSYFDSTVRLLLNNE